MKLSLALHLLLLVFLRATPVFADGSDWYTYYIQCVANSSQEETCYQAVQEFLASDEGRKQAKELGFKRQRQNNLEQMVAQSVVITSRIQQMESYLASAMETASEDSDTVRTYCLIEKQAQIRTLKKSAEEKKEELFKTPQNDSNRKVEDQYQTLLSFNSLANEIYQQARKCLK
ncbi:hypothetical protein EBR03_08270 [bacterium]|nr:hypothetical protein [bacterium]